MKLFIRCPDTNVLFGNFRPSTKFKSSRYNGTTTQIFHERDSSEKQN